ncbi:MAG: hypothetical protein V4510_12960 [bacterium]
MSNVDKELHNPEVTAKNLIKERTTSKPKGALRGAAGGIYIGPVLSAAAIDHMRDTTADEHAIGGTGAGGVDASTGYRQGNSWGVDGDATGFGMGAGGTRTLRPNPGATADGGRQVFRGNGTFGGSVAGYPAQRVGQRGAAATGSSLTGDGGAAAFIDKRSDSGRVGGALGSAGRGTRVTSASGTVTVASSGKTKVSGSARIPVPVIQEAANPNSGTVSVGDGVGVVTGDLHADDITGGALGLAGMVVYIFARGTDTDEDLALVAKGDFDATTEANITGLSGLAAATYACYAAYKTADGNVGPWSARGTVVVS